MPPTEQRVSPLQLLELVLLVVDAELVVLNRELVFEVVTEILLCAERKPDQEPENEQFAQRAARGFLLVVVHVLVDLDDRVAGLLVVGRLDRTSVTVRTKRIDAGVGLALEGRVGVDAGVGADVSIGVEGVVVVIGRELVGFGVLGAEAETVAQQFADVGAELDVARELVVLAVQVEFEQCNFVCHAIVVRRQVAYSFGLRSLVGATRGGSGGRARFRTVHTRGVGTLAVNEDQRAFLDDLLETPSPSGFETRGQAVWTDYASEFADEVRTDDYGNAVAVHEGAADAPSIALTGHADEIGFVVRDISEEGFVHLDSIGGADKTVSRGQHVTIHADGGSVSGVIGQAAIHLRDDHETADIAEQHVDIGAEDGDEARELVEVGDPITIASTVEELHGTRLAARGMDNRVGTWAAAEGLRRASEADVDATVCAVSTV